MMAQGRQEQQGCPPLRLLVLVAEEEPPQLHELHASAAEEEGLEAAVPDGRACSRSPSGAAMEAVSVCS